MTAKVSGGKLNPAVSLGLFVAGSLPLRKCLLEMGSQVLGGVLGAALSRLLILGTTFQTYANCPDPPCPFPIAGESATCLKMTNPIKLPSAGCFTGGHNAVWPQIFLWEFITTFVLVSVVFATAVDDAAAGHFVSVAPFVIGLSLFACAQASGPYTGGCLNPARFIGPWVVFGDPCYNRAREGGVSWSIIFPYIIAELLGGALAGLLFKLRLRLQMLYKETLEELGAQQQQSDAADTSALLGATDDTHA
jgi:aquaporin Z